MKVNSSARTKEPRQAKRGEGEPEPYYQVRALERAFRILDCFTVEQPQLGLAELAKLSGVNKSTLLRLLRVMETIGLVGIDPDTGRYRLGIKVFELGSVYYLTNLKIDQVARPSMQWLVDRRQLTANLAVLDDGQIVYISIAEPHRVLRVTLSVGARFAVHCTALGKVLVSELPEAALDQILKKRGMAPLTARTITDAVVFKNHLAAVRQQGVGVDDEEAIANIRCVAAPIRNGTGEIVAALSVSGSVLDVTREVLADVAEDVKEAARQISLRLGAPSGARSSA